MSGIRMIWFMTVEGLLNTDWLGFLGVVAPPIISAWVAYLIARYQIDTQLKKQNELEVKKENRMLVTKIRLDKHELFLSTLTEYLNLERSSYFNIVNYRDGSKTLEQAENSDNALRLKVGQTEDNLSVLILYYPKLENDLKDLFFFRNISLCIKQLLFCRR